ncbi:MAG: radical SAM protein [Anaerolineae bacterium]|nr:radical SAM protein [Anaerolineae bacterium]
MIIPITPETHSQITNPVFFKYAALYLGIYDRFMEQIRATGIAIDAQNYAEEAAQRRERLRRKGAHIRNGGRSIYVNAISPACVACKKGVGSATFFISLRCHRDCFYCFNPNQVDYEFHTSHTRNLVQELDEIAAQGQQMDCIALTGGEPLLHKDEALAFFRRARELYPHAHQRLYTCGDYVDEPILRDLQAACLDEIRFSIRMHDTPKARQHILERIALARQYIPQVMVEMPVPPGARDEMRALLLELDRIGIFSVNLLELCYPLINAAEFNARGFEAKARPYETLYDYWYAGGVPIARSELDCLDLVEFTLDQKLSIGVHYCSLENKFTGQNYQQNYGRKLPGTVTLSSHDYLLKSAKVFGDDIPPVLDLFERTGVRDYEHDSARGYLEFGVNHIRGLKHLDIEIGISTSTLEQRADGMYLRELKVDLTRPEWFKAADI